MRGNKIGHKGVKDLSQALKMNGALKKLNLIENKIDDADAKDIAEALKVNTSLNSLKLENNKIGPAGTKEIAEALKNNTSLTKLYLQHNEIGYEGENALIEALKINSIMTNLNYFILNRNSKFEAGGDADVDTALNMDDNSDTDSNTDGDTEVIAGRENEVHGLLYRNTLWPLTYGAGVGMSNMINQQYSESINTFPSEVGNLIAKNMLSVGIKDENLVEDFQQIENNLKELMYGAALHNNPTPIDFI
jgi:hypothetical protein